MKDEAESDEEKEEPQPKKARTRPKLCEPGGGGSEWVILGSLDQHNLPSGVFNKKKKAWRGHEQLRPKPRHRSTLTSPRRRSSPTFPGQAVVESPYTPVLNSP